MKTNFDMIDFLKEQWDALHIKKGIVVDIGAYNGVNVIATSDRLRPYFYHAIEPFPRAYNQLCIKKGARINIKTHNVAITNNDGTTSLYGLKGTDDKGRVSQSSSMFAGFIMRKTNPRQSGVAVTVSTQTLRTFCSRNNIEHINLLRLNCEGSEFMIFEDEQSWSILFGSDIIYLNLHGKSPLFLSNRYAEKKRRINRMLNQNGYKIVFGTYFGREAVVPVKHIKQVWVKSC